VLLPIQYNTIILYVKNAYEQDRLLHHSRKNFTYMLIVTAIHYQRTQKIQLKSKNLGYFKNIHHD